MRSLAVWSLGSTLLLATACKDREPAERESPPARPPPAAVAAPETPGPWFSGRWAAQVSLEAQPSALAADARDRGEAPPNPASTGVTPEPGTPASPVDLALSIDDEGTARGALAGEKISGHVDGETLRARLTGGARSGVLIGQKTEGGWSCTLRLSTGDSSSVFASQFLLEPASPGAP